MWVIWEGEGRREGRRAVPSAMYDVSFFFFDLFLEKGSGLDFGKEVEGRFKVRPWIP